MEQKGDTFLLPEIKLQAYKDDQRDEKVLQWGNTFHFSAPPATQINPRKRAPGKIEPGGLIRQDITL